MQMHELEWPSPSPGLYPNDNLWQEIENYDYAFGRHLLFNATYKWTNNNSVKIKVNNKLRRKY